ncbi:redoxin domain-containing protein [Yoonia sp. 208BN28-4]|uniref:redoxin domain-containing protein n=1 Tax=Yoonia sp. 208BN28-4 TaxID=3126505 RepID=UPI0030B2BE32
MAFPKPSVGQPLTPFDLPIVGQETTRTIGAPSDLWTMLFIYRGRHCPRCKRFLNKLNAALNDWAAHMDIIVASADSADKAAADLAEFGWNFELCYDLSEPQMRALGLYVSTPLSEAETTKNFAEPGAFGLRPDGTLMLVDISNGPAARPDLEELLDGMIFNITNDRPVRGTA